MNSNVLSVKSKFIRYVSLTSFSFFWVTKTLSFKNKKSAITQLSLLCYQLDDFLDNIIRVVKTKWFFRNKSEPFQNRLLWKSRIEWRIFQSNQKYFLGQYILKNKSIKLILSKKTCSGKHYLKQVQF